MQLLNLRLKLQAVGLPYNKSYLNFLFSEIWAATAYTLYSDSSTHPHHPHHMMAVHWEDAGASREKEPQYRRQYTLILLRGTPHYVPLILGYPHLLSGGWEVARDKFAAKDIASLTKGKRTISAAIMFAVSAR